MEAEGSAAQPPATLERGWRALGIALAETCLAIGLTAWAYHFFFSHRTDYLGHYLAGAGGTMLVLVVPVLVERKDRLFWTGLVPVMLAIGFGLFTEATIYRLAIFDPVDLMNQSLGAALAGATVIGRNGSFARAAVLAAAGIACLWLGYYFAFL